MHYKSKTRRGQNGASFEVLDRPFI